jgi:hypothetical protein
LVDVNSFLKRSAFHFHFLLFFDFFSKNFPFFYRYYPTQRSLQLHLASVHAQGTGMFQPHKQNTDAIIQAIEAATVRQDPQQQQQQQQAQQQQHQQQQQQQQQQQPGQEVQQFQIQFQDQPQLMEQIGQNQTQQIQIIQTDPNNPDQPQIITLYTWGGN